MHLLFIEDSIRLQTSVGRGLRKAGYAVDITGDGNEGLWLAQSNEYDAIILDLMLPGLDGLSLLKRLRAGKNTAHVLILTAKDAVENRVTGLQAGADDYLVKRLPLKNSWPESRPSAAAIISARTRGSPSMIWK